jgi:hypothetical protein
MNVSVGEVVAAVECRTTTLAAETAGYLALELFVGDPQGRSRVDDAVVSEDGRVTVSLGGAPRAESFELEIRRVLGRLLAQARGVPPGLLRIARGASTGGLANELTAALVPLNRSAARRALSRLVRDVERAVARGLVSRGAPLWPEAPSAPEPPVASAAAPPPAGEMMQATSVAVPAASAVLPASTTAQVRDTSREPGDAEPRTQAAAAPQVPELVADELPMLVEWVELPSEDLVPLGGAAELGDEDTAALGFEPVEETRVLWAPTALSEDELTWIRATTVEEDPGLDVQVLTEELSFPPAHAKPWELGDIETCRLAMGARPNTGPVGTSTEHVSTAWVAPEEPTRPRPVTAWTQQPEIRFSEEEETCVYVPLPPLDVTPTLRTLIRVCARRPAMPLGPAWLGTAPSEAARRLRESCVLLSVPSSVDELLCRFMSSSIPDATVARSLRTLAGIDVTPVPQGPVLPMPIRAVGG